MTMFSQDVLDTVLTTINICFVLPSVRLYWTQLLPVIIFIGYICNSCALDAFLCYLIIEVGRCIHAVYYIEYYAVVQLFVHELYSIALPWWKLLDFSYVKGSDAGMPLFCLIYSDFSHQTKVLVTNLVVLRKNTFCFLIGR